MPQPIRITPQVLQDAAGGHDDVARIVESARERGGDVLASAQSYGPIMHEVTAAVSDLLIDRDTALGDRAGRHRTASSNLHGAVHIYTGTDEQNAEQIRNL